MKAFLDTHAFVSLANGELGRFGKDSRRLLESADLLVSPIVLLELHYLTEIGRLKLRPDHFYARGLDECDVLESNDAFVDVVRESTPLAWTRDVFDRLIVGAAMLHRAKLITRDVAICEHYDDAVW